MSRLPVAGGHVSRPRRAGHLLSDNIRDMSRNRQRDVSRNYRSATCRRARLPARVRCREHPQGRRRCFTAHNRDRAAARDPGGSIGDLLEGSGPLDLGLRAPGIGAQAGSPLTVSAAARMPTSPGVPVARAATSRPCLRLARRSQAGRRGRATPGRRRDRRDRCVPLCSVAGCVRHHSDHEDLAAHRPQAPALQAGGRDCEPGSALAVLPAGEPQAWRLSADAGPRRQGQGLISLPPAASRPEAGASLA